MPETDQQQLQSDLAEGQAEVARLTTDATVLNQANEVLRKGVSTQTYNKMHPELAELSGDIGKDLAAATTQVKEIQAQLGNDAPPVVIPPAPPVITPPVVAPPVVTPPSGAVEPVAPVTVGSLIRDCFAVASIDGSLWGPFDYEPVNGVQTEPGNTVPTNPGVMLKLPSASQGAGICGKGKQYYNQQNGFYMEERTTMQKAANGGTANSHANVWTSSDNWPVGGEFDVAETLSDGGNGVGGAVCTLHHGSGNQASAYDFPKGWAGEHVYGVYFLPDEIQLWADPSGDGETMELMNTWTEEDGVSSALGPWYPCIQLGVSNSEDGNWWGETLVPGELPVGYLRFWNGSPTAKRFGPMGQNRPSTRAPRSTRVLSSAV